MQNAYQKLIYTIINLITNSYIKNEYGKGGSDSLGTPAWSIMKAVWCQEVAEFLSLKSSVG